MRPNMVKSNLFKNVHVQQRHTCRWIAIEDYLVIIYIDHQGMSRPTWL